LPCSSQRVEYHGDSATLNCERAQTWQNLGRINNSTICTFHSIAKAERPRNNDFSNDALRQPGITKTRSRKHRAVRHVDNRRRGSDFSKLRTVGTACFAVDRSRPIKHLAKLEIKAGGRYIMSLAHRAVVQDVRRCNLCIQLYAVASPTSASLHSMRAGAKPYSANKSPDLCPVFLRKFLSLFTAFHPC
jgi:hypothetical protein